MFDPFTLNTLLKEHGRNITLTLLSPPLVKSSYDVVTGESYSLRESFAVRGYFYNDVPQMTENTNVTFGTKRAVLSNKLLNGQDTPQPNVQDLIGYNQNETAAITKVSPIVSNGSVVCFLLHLDS